jgi:transglutaminase-like putative cysteine protease
MLIKLGYDIHFNAPVETSILLLLYSHPSSTQRLIYPERIELEPDIPIENYIDNFGNKSARILAPAGLLKIRYDNIIEDSGEPEPVFPDAVQHFISDLPVETLQFLLPSRYCEVDRLSDIAWSLFGETLPDWSRVQAVCDWVYQNVQFGYEFARPTKTALDVYEERKGVCRDFMHLALTFCRCLGIPARYATGYLGDIGVRPSENPMDFSAFFEVYLGGQWHPFDARHNQRRRGRVLMARGRDAADTALTTSFGVTDLVNFTVWADEITNLQT